MEASPWSHFQLLHFGVAPERAPLLLQPAVMLIKQIPWKPGQQADSAGPEGCVWRHSLRRAVVHVLVRANHDGRLGSRIGLVFRQVC